MSTKANHVDVKRALTAHEFSYLMGLPAWDDRLTALYRCLLGAETWDKAESVDPTRIQLPKAQLADLMTDLDGAMNWVNVGPSSYDEAEAEAEASRRFSWAGAYHSEWCQGEVTHDG